MENSTRLFNSRHILANESIDRQKSQRFDELLKVFDQLKTSWPECFDNLGLFLPEAKLAVMTERK